MGLGLKNQFILVKTIKFSVLVLKKLSVESSINDDVHQKSMFKGLVLFVKYLFLLFLYLLASICPYSLCYHTFMLLVTLGSNLA